MDEIFGLVVESFRKFVHGNFDSARFDQVIDAYVKIASVDNQTYRMIDKDYVCESDFDDDADDDDSADDETESVADEQISEYSEAVDDERDENVESDDSIPRAFEPDTSEDSVGESVGVIMGELSSDAGSIVVVTDDVRDDDIESQEKLESSDIDESQEEVESFSDTSDEDMISDPNFDPNADDDDNVLF